MVSKRIRLALTRRDTFAPSVVRYLEEFCEVGFQPGELPAAVWVQPQYRLQPGGSALRAVRYVLTNTTDTGHVADFCDSRPDVRLISLQDPAMREGLEKVVATADHTETLMRQALRAIDRDHEPGRLIEGARVALLVEHATAPGRVARQLAPRLEKLGAHVCYIQPDQLGSIELLHPDVLSVHLPATEPYEYLIDRGVLRHLPDGCTLVNTSRGNLVYEPDVFLALSSGRLHRYATDFETTLTGPRVLMTPHVAGYERESLAQTQWLVAERFREILDDDGARLGAVS